MKINDLPKDWKWIEVGKIATVNPKLSNKENIKKDLEVQFLPMKLIEAKNNKFHLIETRFFNEVQNGSYTSFIDGDIIFAKVTPCMENGKIAIVNKLKNGIGYGSSEFHVIRSGNAISNKYLFYYIIQDRFRSAAENAMTGAVGLRRVPKQFIENNKIPFPPKLTQQAIVSKIEELFSELDKGIENLRLAQQQLKTYRQSVLKWAFEGKLTNENVNEGELQKKWKMSRLGDMFDFVGGGTPSKNEKSYWNGNIFWASVKDIKGDYLNKTLDTITENGLKNSASNLALPGDVILITRISPGKSIISNVRSAINQDLKIAKPKFKTSSKFINYYFNAIERECIKKASGTTVLGITLNNLNELEIPELNIVEQNKIVQEIEKRISVAEKIEESITQSLQQAEALRQSILKKAFEGKLI